jgi:peptide deformylase
MSVLDVVRFPDKRLWVVSDPVEDINEELIRLIHEMSVTMFVVQGIGLSAIQIGVPLQLFIVEPKLLGGAADDDPVVFINPEITWRSDEKELRIESCVSLPEVEVRIRRSSKVKVEASSLSNARFEMELEDEAARVIQHEYDHLAGKTIYDYANRSKKKRILKKLVKEIPPWLKRGKGKK